MDFNAIYVSLKEIRSVVSSMECLMEKSLDLRFHVACTKKNVNKIISCIFLKRMILH